MKFYYVALLTGLLLGNTVLQAAETPNIGEITQELSGERPQKPRSAAQLDTAYTLVLTPLLPDMGSEDPGRRNGAQSVIERIAFRASRPGAEAERAACSKAIAAALTPRAGPLARVWLLRQLERIGREEAVPQVAAMLTDGNANVRESARRALQKNPAKDANAALQKALGSADTAWRAALLNALGQRRDPSNLNILVQACATDNDDVRMAALVGLANLADKSAAAPIVSAMAKGGPRAQRLAADCYLRLAETLAAAGDKAAALSLYKNMLSREGHLKCAALIGIGRCGSASDLPTLLDALADQDVKVRGACVEAFSLFQGEEATAALVARMQTPNPKTKLAVLQALARRGRKTTMPVFMAAAQDADGAVRVAAIVGLGTVGNADTVPLLLKAATTSGVVQEAARQSLQALVGAQVSCEVLTAIGDKDAKIRVEAVRAVSARHIVAATPMLLKAAEDADANVRHEALRALGVVAPSSALAPLAAVLVRATDDGARSEAANALVNIATRDADIEGRSEPVLAALASAHGAAEFSLLGVLGRIGGKKSLDGVRAAVREQDEKVKDAAVHALIEWPDALAADDLLVLAKTSANETHRVLATRGYIRVCAIRCPRPDAETAKLLVAGLEVAKRPEEKWQALSALGEVRDILALQAAMRCMGDAALREEAAVAAVRIGRDIWNDHPQAVKDAMRKAIEVSKNQDLKRDAKEALGRAEQKLKEAKPK
jgi:HEAT repeat protein